MSNRPALLLWLSVRAEGKRRVRFAFPFFLPGLLLFAEMLADVLEFIRLLSFGRLPRPGRENEGGFAWAVWSVELLRALARGVVFETGPCDLIDIEAGDGGRVKIVCRLI